MERRGLLKSGGSIVTGSFLAGCFQAPGDSPDKQDTRTNPTENDRNSPTSTASIEYPPGMTNRGIDDARELSRVHLTELLEKSFTAVHRYQRRLITPEGELDKQVNSVEHAQVVDEGTLRATYEVTGDASVFPIRSGGLHTDYDQEQYANEGTLYKYENETGEVVELSAHRPSSEYTFFGSIASGFSDVPLSSVETFDERNLFWVGKTHENSLRDDSFTPRRTFGIVREDGVFEKLSQNWKKRHPTTEGIDVINSSVMFFRIGKTTINDPEWL